MALVLKVPIKSLEQRTIPFEQCVLPKSFTVNMNICDHFNSCNFLFPSEKVEKILLCSRMETYIIGKQISPQN